MGGNGSGKTTILDGIAIGLGEILTYLPGLSGISFKKQGEIYQHNNKLAPYALIELQTSQGIKWDRLIRRDNSQRTSQQLPSRTGIKALHQYLDNTVLDPFNDGIPFELPLFAYYGVNRALLDVPLTRKGFSSTDQRFEALANAFNADARFRSAFVWFYNKENAEHRLQKALKSFDVTLTELDCVRSAITRIFPDLSEPHIETHPLRFMVKKQGESFNITQLSGGYRTLLGMVIDLAARMAMANPHLDDPLAAEAIVMIDELDLHLHPEWQQRILGDLLATFPGTQFIISTHSPYIIESVNNHLKRANIDHLNIPDSDIFNILPLPAKDVAAYLVEEGQVQSLMDPQLKLLNDKLLENFNSINRLYDAMRDLEWEQGS